VAENSGVGVAAAAVIETFTVLLLVMVTGRAALVVPTVCVLNVSAVTLREKARRGSSRGRAGQRNARISSCIRRSVNVAVRFPAAVGVNVAPIVQVPPAATETEAPTQVPVR